MVSRILGSGAESGPDGKVCNPAHARRRCAKADKWNENQGTEFPVAEGLTQIGVAPGMNKAISSTRTKVKQRKMRLGIESREIRDIEEGEIGDEKEIEPSPREESESDETSLEEESPKRKDQCSRRRNRTGS